jgi:Lar family restriction alleviation protein
MYKVEPEKNLSMALYLFLNDLEDNSTLNVDDFFEAFNVPAESRNDFVFGAILDGAYKIEEAVWKALFPKVEFKNCPFCGSSASFFEEKYDGRYFCYVTCHNCGIEMEDGFRSREEALQAWNKRY